MTVSQIESNIKKIVDDPLNEEFVFNFLLAYGKPKATIARLRKGKLNQLESRGELTTHRT
jgi:hypothetical protein